MNKEIFEELGLVANKNLLVQGLPTSLKKEFGLLKYFDQMNPFLRGNKIDAALIFAVNTTHLIGLTKQILPSLKPNAKLNIAFPKSASKIGSDLNKPDAFDFLVDLGYGLEKEVVLDLVWAVNIFKRNDARSIIIDIEIPEGITDKKVIEIVKNICRLANEEHIAQGGQGLIIKDSKVETEVDVLINEPI